jgi:CRISPR-associated protein Cas2
MFARPYTYDVADDRRRYHLCKALERYGIRIQYSVFELSLKPKDLHKLVDHLTGLIDNTGDRLLVMQLCGGCLRSMGRYGNMTSYSPEGSSTVNRGHEHHLSIRRFSAREGRPRCLGGIQRGGGTGNDSSSWTVQQ